MDVTELFESLTLAEKSKFNDRCTERGDDQHSDDERTCGECRKIIEQIIDERPAKAQQGKEN